MGRRAFPHLAAAVLLLAPAFAPAAPDEVDDAVAAFRERLALALDAPARAVAVHEFGARRDPRVAEELKPLLRHADVEVRAAAARCLGRQGDPSLAGLLVAAYEKEDDEKAPQVPFLAALVEGIGEADPKGRWKVLKKAAWKWLDAKSRDDLAIPRAAVHGLAQARTPDAIEACIALMEEAERWALAQKSDEWKAAYRGVEEQAKSDLAKATGRPILTVKGWRDWWKENGKSWKPPAPGAAAAPAGGDPDLWVDATERFALRRPSGAWNLLDGGKDYSLVAEARSEGRVAAKIWVWVQDIATLASQTPAAMAAERRPHIEEGFTEIAKEGTAWGRKTFLGGEKAVANEVRGRSRTWDVCTLRNVYCAHEGGMYFVVGMVRAGKEDPLCKEFDALFESFRFRGR